MDFHLRFLIFISGLISVGHHYVHAIQLSVQLWKKMTSVNKTEEFLQRFIRKANDSTRLDQDEYDKQMESILFTMQGSLKKSGLDVATSVMAAEDGCSPRMTSVSIPTHSDPYILYWPSCTQIPQCGGCCGHESLECQPKRKQDHSVLVMRARHPEPGAEIFMFEGMDTIVLDEHLECECRCRVQSTHCNPLVHTYDEDSCSCRCNNENEAVRCAANQHWENMQCACVCNKKPSCAHDEVFNNSTCRCDDVPTSKPKVPTNPCTDIRCRQGYVPRQFGSFCRCEFNMHQVMPASGRGRDTVAAGIPILPHYLPASSSQQHRVNRFPSRRV